MLCDLAGLGDDGLAARRRLRAPTLLSEGNEQETGYADRARAKREHGFEREQTRNQR